MKPIDPNKHPSNDDRIYGFGEDGKLRPISRRGPKPRTGEAFSWWMFKRGLTNKGLAGVIGCGERTIARARRGARISWFYAREIRKRWPDAPVRVRGTRPNLGPSPLDKYLKRG